MTQQHAPTHVAYYPGHPDLRIEVCASTFGEVDGLVQRAKDRGIAALPVVVKIAEAPSAQASETVEVATTIAVVPADESEDQRAVRIGVSDFGGSLKTDETAKGRIDAQHAALGAAGIQVDASQQLYATGTRMAEVGYATQAARKVEHDKLLPLREAAEALRAEVLAEQREDLVFDARDLAAKIEINGKLRVAGFAMGEQAIRGLMGRCDAARAAGYIFMLRDRCKARIAAASAIEDLQKRGEAVSAAQRANAKDKDEIAAVLGHELDQARGTKMKLRTRASRGDCFAVLSPGYAPADAPEVIEALVGGLPEDAKGSFSYDADTTCWELRADLWTPTPVAEQAVGEAFRGYASFTSRDNGGASLKGGGGIELLRCLNASTYSAAEEELRRRHVGGILLDVPKMVAGARRALDALTAAWGVAREVELAVPAELAKEGPLPLSIALPGFWFGALKDDRCELARVLPGRTVEHVKALSATYLQERRDPERLVKADMAQAWTRYIQGQPADVRREAERAAAAFVASRRPVRFDADSAFELAGV